MKKFFRNIAMSIISGRHQSSLFDVTLETTYEENEENERLLDAVEVVIMTVIFFGFMLISVERLVCITLNMKYKVFVNESLVKWVIFVKWMLGVLLGFVLWIGKDISNRKIYFYLVLDILVIVLTIVTYSCILRVYHTSRQSLAQESSNLRNEVKILRVPFLIITSFILCNSIPDVILFLVREEIKTEMYCASVVLWAVGFLLDPLIYIFLNKKTRLIARTTFENTWGKCKGTDCSIPGRWRKTQLILETNV